MSGTENLCPLCKAAVRAIPMPGYALTRISCPCCGVYEVCEDEFDFDWVKGPRHLLSHFLRLRYDRTGRPFKFEDREGGQFPPPPPELPVSSKLRLALACVAEKTPKFGRPSSCSVEKDWPLAQAADPDEFKSMLMHWVKEGALEGNLDDPLTVQARGGLVLTGKGWQLADEIGAFKAAEGAQAFVAMSFGKDMDCFYDEGIAPALKVNGYASHRVDRVQHNEKICDRILADIRRSSLLIADVTQHKQGVYFEAGFALGLGIPVIWCCRSSDLGNAHFDTRQYNHVAWDSADELREKLTNRIAALYPRKG